MAFNTKLGIDRPYWQELNNNFGYDVTTAGNAFYHIYAGKDWRRLFFFDQGSNFCSAYDTAGNGFKRHVFGAGTFYTQYTSIEHCGVREILYALYQNTAFASFDLQLTTRTALTAPSNAFSSVHNMVHTCSRLVATANDDYIYHLGSTIASGFKRYSISGGTWSNMADAPNLGATTYQRIFWADQYDSDKIIRVRRGSTSTSYLGIDAYSIAANTWATLFENIPLDSTSTWSSYAHIGCDGQSIYYSPSQRVSGTTGEVVDYNIYKFNLANTLKVWECVGVLPTVLFTTGSQYNSFEVMRTPDGVPVIYLVESGVPASTTIANRRFMKMIVVNPD